MGTTSGSPGLFHRVLDFADVIDAGLYGKRWAILLGLSTVLTTISIWEAETKPWDLRVTVVFTLILAAYLEVLLLARIGSFRDDAKRWSADLVRERWSVWWDDLGESWKTSSALPTALRLQGVGKLVLGIALVVLALRNVLVITQVILGEVFSTRSTELTALNRGVWIAGGVGVLLGLILWLIGRRLARQTDAAKQLVIHDEERQALSQTTRALPAGIIDCRDPAVLANAARAHSHPLFTELLRTLGTWNPRAHASEAKYTSSLVRKLRERMPSASMELERPMKHQGQRFRADLVLGDAVLVEMKRGLSQAAAQRALGQVQMYSLVWASKGPIILLVCGTPRPVVEQHFGPHLHSLRQQGVLVAVAG